MVCDAEADRSDIVILDAQKISAGAIAKLYLRHHLPYGLHGSFTPEVWLYKVSTWLGGKG